MDSSSFLGTPCIFIKQDVVFHNASLILLKCRVTGEAK
jgi:hypothetical protein